MKEATIIYPHQLFLDSPVLVKDRAVFLVEECLLLTHNPIHRQKLQLHKLSMDAYQKDLEEKGYEVERLSIQDYPDTNSVFTYLQTKNIKTIHVTDTTDTYLEKVLNDSGLERVWYDSPLFILSKAEAVARYQDSNKHLAKFYKQLRKDKDILMEEDGSPTGGTWSFDEDNRKKVPRGVLPPSDIAIYENKDTAVSEVWLETVDAEMYGETGAWLPYTHAGAKDFLQTFLQERFASFGPYEDALTTDHHRLWHSTLSPLLNIGLLTPTEVLEAALLYAKNNEVPINSLEGFVRQILGWREFIRASYECDGSLMRNQNFWNHTRSLPETFWNGTTGIFPIDNVIEKALQSGYNHHIERLMVLGNFMLLSQVHPTQVYRWFMAMYIDAYDWVMVPNVYGMSQFADGGTFATKPYISGSNYLKKMSSYPSGEWEKVWTALYWHFIDTHKDFFLANHRLSMMPRLLEKMDTAKQNELLATANAYLNK